MHDTGVFDRQPLLRCVRRVRQGGAGGHPDPHHARQPRAGGGAAARAADALVSQHLVVGAVPRRGRRRSPSCAGATRVRCSPRTRRSGEFVFEHRRQRSAAGCSPRTRPTPRGSTASPNASARRQGRASTTTWSTAGRTPCARERGTKAAPHYRLSVPPQSEVVLRLRLRPAADAGDAGLRRGLRRGCSRSAGGRAMRSTRPRIVPTLQRRSAAGGAPGLRRAALDQAVLPLRGRGMAARAIRASRRRPSARDGATATGRTCSTATSSRCPTSGNTRGTRPGTWRST